MAIRKVIITIEYDENRSEDPLTWDWGSILNNSVTAGALKSVGVDEFESQICGPWSDGSQEVVFQPVYEDGRVGFHVTCGSFTETWSFNPSSGGDSPDFFVYRADGAVSLDPADTDADVQCYFTVCRPLK